MRSDDEETVIQILRQSGFWDNPKRWRYFDDNENNYSVIGNQQSRPDAALVEKLVNSIDHYLINQCRTSGIDPEGVNAPRSIREAVARFFEDNPNKANAGLVREWPDSRRTEIARQITLTTTGASATKGDPCISVADEGEGQTPDMLPTTFLSLSKSNKLRIPFVQGKFNMGGTGVLKFCGAENLQLIVTRRNPRILGEAPADDDRKWAFTVVRREEPSEGRKSSAYTYLAPIGSEERPRQGGVLRFSAETLSIMPDGGKAYSRPVTHGSLVKLYEYSMPGFKSHMFMKSGLLSKLDLLLPAPALPVRLYEYRDYRGSSGSRETNLSGIQVRLEDNKAETQESGFPASFTISIDGEALPATIYTFKAGRADTYKKTEAILFAINGQTHGHLTTDFLKRNSIGLSYLADSVLVVLDCSKLKPRSIEDLFMNSRDRLSHGPLRRSLENLLEEQLHSNQLLRELQERRRREMVQNRLKDSAPMEEVLKDIMKKNPTLARLFVDGARLNNPFKTREVDSDPVAFDGKRYPTYFKHKDRKYGELLNRECHINLRPRLTFETDAENDYFSREIDRGIAEILWKHENSREEPVKSHTLNLQNGVATLSVVLPEATEVGDELTLVCRVSDPTRLEPFANTATLIVRKASDDSKGKGQRRNPPADKPGKKREKPEGLALPTMILVDEASWNKHDPPFDRYTAVDIKQTGELAGNGGDHAYDLYLNIDNVFLKHEQKGNPSEAMLTQAKYQYGMALVALGLIHEHKNSKVMDESDNEHTSDADLEKQVKDVTRALAPVLLPLIDSLGGLTTDSIADSGLVAEGD